MIPATIPIHGLPVALATTAEAKAPESSIPSMAMFTTPERSQMMPDMAPKVIGTLRCRVSCRIPARFMLPPEPAQVRKLKAKPMMTSVSTMAQRAPKPRVSWTTPKSAAMAASTYAVPADGTTRSGNLPPPTFMPKVVVDPDCTWPKKASITTASSR